MHLHAGVGQIQGIESILASSLELFLINESAIGYGRLDHVHSQVLVCHRNIEHLTLMTRYTATNLVENDKSEGVALAGDSRHSLSTVS